MLLMSWLAANSIVLQGKEAAIKLGIIDLSYLMAIAAAEVIGCSACSASSSSWAWRAHLSIGLTCGEEKKLEARMRGTHHNTTKRLGGQTQGYAEIFNCLLVYYDLFKILCSTRMFHE